MEKLSCPIGIHFWGDLYPIFLPLSRHTKCQSSVLAYKVKTTPVQHLSSVSLYWTRNLKCFSTVCCLWIFHWVWKLSAIHTCFHPTQITHTHTKRWTVIFKITFKKLNSSNFLVVIESSFRVFVSWLIWTFKPRSSCKNTSKNNIRYDSCII